MEQRSRQAQGSNVINRGEVREELVRAQGSPQPPLPAAAPSLSPAPPGPVPAATTGPAVAPSPPAGPCWRCLAPPARVLPSGLRPSLLVPLCPISPITSPLSGGLLGLAEPFALALNLPDPSTTPLMRLSPPFAGWHRTPGLHQPEAAAGPGLGVGWGQEPPRPHCRPRPCRIPPVSLLLLRPEIYYSTVIVLNCI